MLSRINYILKNKSHVVSSANKDQDIVLSTFTFKDHLLLHLGITEKQCIIKDGSMFLYINIIDGSSNLNGIILNVYQSPKSLFLNVTVSGGKKHNIYLLETFDKIFQSEIYVTPYLGEQICLTNDYDIIKTYDDVSKYYCDLIYPSLNEFDRKMRLLLYNTYYILYGDEFYKKFNYGFNKNRTKLIKIKENPKRVLSDEVFLDSIFYAYDYSQLIDILFGEDINEFENPKSDWQLYFSNKIDFQVRRKDMEEIKNLRNSVAHCKLFTKSEYQRLKYILSKYNKALDKGIELTYSKDFVDECRASIEDAIKQISSKLNELCEILSKVYL